MVEWEGQPSALVHRMAHAAAALSRAMGPAKMLIGYWQITLALQVP